MKRVVAALAILASVVACSNGEQANIALNEPLQVSGGQFIPGALPGEAAIDGGGDGGAALAMPAVTFVSYESPTILSGIQSKSLGGYVTEDAVAVGVRFADMGTGYWVVPVLGVDTQQPGERDFSLSASFNRNDPTGFHPLLFVGIAKDGTAGTQYSQSFCIESRVPDNGHACYPKTYSVPPVVFSLTWDTGFDLDLHVITPDGHDVNPKSDLVVGDGGGINTLAELSASNHIDRDSWGNCAPDGWFEEDLIFQTAPAPGAYQVRADPFAACGQAAVRFTFTLYEAGKDGNLHSTYSQSGELISSQVTGGQTAAGWEPVVGGQSPGIFVYQAQF
jgi:hypothetical protein